MQSLGKHILTGISYITISNSVGRVASFLTLLIVTHNLSLYEFGLITLALAITGPAFSIMSLGLDKIIESDVARYLGEDKKGKAKKLLIEYYSMRTFLTCVILIVGWFSRAMLSARYGAIVLDATVILMLYVCIQSIKTSFHTIIQTHQRFKLFAAMTGLEPYIRLIFVTALWVMGHITPTTILISYLVAPATAVLFATPYLIQIAHSYTKTHAARESVLANTMRHHGKWQTVLNIVSSSVDAAKIVLIKLLISTEAIAIYSVATSAYSTFASLIPLRNVLTPIIAQYATKKDKLQWLLSKVTKYAIFMYSTIALAGIIASPFIIIFFFPKYVDSIAVLQIMMVRLILNFSAVTHAPLLTALRQQKFQIVSSMINPVSLVIVGIPLIHIWGVMGVAMELVVTVSLQVVFREWWVRKKYNITSINVRAICTYDETDKYIINTCKRMFARIRRKH